MSGRSDRGGWTGPEGRSRVWSDERGAGPLVVLVHGSMDRSGGMLRVRRLLTDFRVARYDRRGYGRSLSLGPSPSFAHQVDDLEGVVGDRPAIIAGHSFGGLVALAFAERRPELGRAVVAYEAPLMWAPWWPSPAGQGTARPLDAEDVVGREGSGRGEDADPAGDAAEGFMRRMIGDTNWDRLPPAVRLQRRSEGRALLAELATVRDPLHPPFDAARLLVPVVAAHGSASREHHVRSSRVLAASVRYGELRVVDGAEHGCHLSHPDGFAALVRRASVLAGGAEDSERHPSSDEARTARPS